MTSSDSFTALSLLLTTLATPLLHPAKELLQLAMRAPALPMGLVSGPAPAGRLERDIHAACMRCLWIARRVARREINGRLRLLSHLGIALTTSEARLYEI